MPPGRRQTCRRRQANRREPDKQKPPDRVLLVLLWDFLCKRIEHLRNQLQPERGPQSVPSAVVGPENTAELIQTHKLSGRPVSGSAEFRLIDQQMFGYVREPSFLPLCPARAKMSRASLEYIRQSGKFGLLWPNTLWERPVVRGQ